MTSHRVGTQTLLRLRKGEGSGGCPRPIPQSRRLQNCPVKVQRASRSGVKAIQALPTSALRPETGVAMFHTVSLRKCGCGSGLLCGQLSPACPPFRHPEPLSVLGAFLLLSSLHKDALGRNVLSQVLCFVLFSDFCFLLLLPFSLAL